VDDRHGRTGRELRYAADIAGSDQVGRGLGDVVELAVAQSRRQLRLQ